MKRFAIFITTTLFISAPSWSACNANININKPSSIYIDHGDGTVTDKESGLMWMKCSVGKTDNNCSTGSAISYNWKQAVETASSANGGIGTNGYNDWRLPSIAELRTLIDNACIPTINSFIFPSVASGRYWSSTPYLSNSSMGMYTGAWFIDFQYGSEDDTDKPNTYYVRLVRGGQW